jgi:alpha-L-fucosidase 2
MKAKNLHLVLVLFFGISLVADAQPSLKLWYDKPATQWVEALPVGNGRIGGMIFGGVEKELIQLNESTLYSGGPVKRNINPGAHTYLPQIDAGLIHRVLPAFGRFSNQSKF